MNSNDTLQSRFYAVVRRLRSWHTINDIYGLCEKHSVFADADIEELVKRQKKAQIRRMLRQIGRTDTSGADAEEVEWINLIRQTAEGRQEQVYKQLSLFDENDFVQVIQERRSRVEFWQSEVDRLIRIAVDRFGPRFKQDFLSFE